jgi:hypothetical protein
MTRPYALLSLLIITGALRPLYRSYLQNLFNETDNRECHPQLLVLRLYRAISKTT